MDAIVRLLIDQTREIAESTWWDHPDMPGGAYITDVFDRLNNPEEYRAFRKTADGAYLLEVIEAYEQAFSDDWLPFGILGLPLDKAREFLQIVVKELETNSIDVAVPTLRELYLMFSDPA
jgi:hypothetical protein